MTVLKRVASQASLYFVAEALGQLTGFVSMPVFTRILSTAQYGVMGLVDTALRFASTFSGVGLRPAVIRLWGEFKGGKRAGGTEALSSSMFSASFVFGVVIALLCCLVVFVPERILSGEARGLIVMAAPLILFRNIVQMLQCVVQSQERAAFRSVILLAERYLILAFTLLFVAGFGWGLKGFFGGLLAAEGLLFLYCMVYAVKRLHWRPRVWNSPVVRESMLYGLPLLGLNFSGAVTDWGDRFVLGYFCDPSELGLYVAGYNLASYATALFVPALNSALIPVTMNAWAEQGPEETSRSLAKFLRYYALVALPVVFGIWAISTEAIRLLASARYKDAALVIPWVLGAKAIQGAYYPCLAGFFLSKKTGYLALLLGGAAVLNLVLNWFMIPSMGMMGAAVATLVSFAFYIFVGGAFSQRYLRLRFPLRSFLAYGAAALAMFALLRLIPSPANDALALAIKIPLGAAIYGILVVALDGEARTLTRRILAKVRRR